ncbi:colicin-like pore-forming protein [Enterobacter cloacae]|uniref:colicin-like pore-forming protein n=1 Tax=Enterobacter cloacae TaxID=550 RepID=UPI000B8D2D5D|nr:colicin-like pore-forming protein [Enterobacter cloacae]ASQ15691.1 Colicin-A [Enterobacter cloacae]
MKVYQADKDALINAWKSLNADDMASKLGNLSWAFKVADVAMKVEKVREKSIEGYETGNWGPLMLEVESWVLSGMASAVALGIFGGIVSTFLVAGSLPATVAMIGGIITISYLASLIDAEVAEK